jgi:hypothetical protein
MQSPVSTHWPFFSVTWQYPRTRDPAAQLERPGDWEVGLTASSESRTLSRIHASEPPVLASSSLILLLELQTCAVALAFGPSTALGTVSVCNADASKICSPNAGNATKVKRRRTRNMEAPSCDLKWKNPGCREFTTKTLTFQIWLFSLGSAHCHGSRLRRRFWSCRVRASAKERNGSAVPFFCFWLGLEEET